MVNEVNSLGALHECKKHECHALSRLHIECWKKEQTTTNTIPIEAFMLTKDHSPRDSQDDKIFPKHFEIILYFENIH